MKNLITIILFGLLTVKCTNNFRIEKNLTNTIKNYIDFVSDEKLYILVEEVLYYDKVIFRINSSLRLDLLSKKPNQIYKYKKNIILFCSSTVSLGFEKNNFKIEDEMKKKFKYDLYENNGEWFFISCFNNNSIYKIIKNHWYEEFFEIKEINDFKCLKFKK